MGLSISRRIGLLSLLLAAGLCTAVASTPTRTNDRVLKHVPGKECGPGYLRPPGVRKCMNLQDLVSANPPARAPKGICPEHWQRYPANRFCLPSYVVVSCGKKTFPCRKAPSDILKVKSGPVSCQKGSRVVAVQIPLFDTDDGLFLTSRTGLACGPPVKTEQL